MCIGQELAETLGLYVLVFIIISALIFYRNYLFQTLNKYVFNQPTPLFNTSIFTNYTFFFFNVLKKTKSTLVSKTSSLKNKLKK
jgi:hypothetical protein